MLPISETKCYADGTHTQLHERPCTQTHIHTGGTLEATLTPSKLFVCTSEPDIICEIKQAVSDSECQSLAEEFNVRLSFIVSQNDSRMVVIKAPVKPAPAVHSFFVMVYRYVLLHE